MLRPDARRNIQRWRKRRFTWADVCTVETRSGTQTEDDYGENTTPWTVLLTDQSCRAHEVTENIIAGNEVVATITRWRFRFPYDVALPDDHGFRITNVRDNQGEIVLVGPIYPYEVKRLLSTVLVTSRDD